MTRDELLARYAAGERDFGGVNLSGADLFRVNLSGANLSGVSLSGANLSGASLSWANLSGVSLSGANLSGADLFRANLFRANLSGADLPHYQIVPEVGAFEGWKKLAGGVIARVQIPADARRVSSLVGRKCRAERVVVVELIGASVGTSQHDPSVVYRVGETVAPNNGFNDDPRVECAPGIHFFITRREAEEY